MAKTGRKDDYFVSTQAGSVSRCRCFCLVLCRYSSLGAILAHNTPLLPPSYLVFSLCSLLSCLSLSSSRYRSVSVSWGAVAFVTPFRH